MMKRDLRGRDDLRRSAELAALAHVPAFDALDVADLRKLAELIRDFGAGCLDAITVETAAAFGGTSRHRLQSVLRALRALMGDDHPAVRAVEAAKRTLHQRRPGARHRDCRSRPVILEGAHWPPFRDLPAAGSMPLNELRAVDRYLAFCAEGGRPGGEVPDFLAFVETQASSMLLRTLRNGLERLFSPAHPAIVAAEKARSLKETERYRRRKPSVTPTQPRDRDLEASVPYEELPASWRELFEALQARKRVRGRKLAPKSIENLTTAARQFIHAVREAGLPEDICLDTISAYDRVLEARGTRFTSRQTYFTSLRTLAHLLDRPLDLLADLQDLIGHYEREARGDVKVKEGRLADLPDLTAIFDKVNALLDQAARTTDRRCLTTCHVDAAALAFLSLIPLRNQDTVLHWGSHIVFIGDDDPGDWGLEDRAEPLGYYLDLRTSKTDTDLSGPLAPILTPFLDALILRGQDERLLPQLRSEIMTAQAPVFPKSNGAPRNVRNLSVRWREQVGTGAVISRTRIHTLLGALGEHGVRAALALCAQRSARTARWYQADGLARRRMLESQEMTADLIELSPEEERLLEGLS